MSELETLLEPIAGSASGCGEDLSFSEAFSQIQKSRVNDEDNLAQGEWVTQRHQSDWPFVLHTSANLLAKESKDLRLAMWWAEANTKLNGFAGFAAGLELLSALSDKFWEYIYPEAEQGDQEARIVLLRWFTTNIQEVLRAVEFADAEGVNLSINQLISARSLDDQIRKQPDLEEELKQGRLTVSQFQQLLAASSRQQLLDQLQQLSKARDQWQVFTENMDSKLGYDAPVFTAVFELLDEIKSQIERVTGSSVESALDTTKSEQSTPQSVEKAHTAPSGPVLQLSGGNHLESRRQALEALQKISDYFKMHEPHSPVNYLLDKAIYWANLPLHEWLKQVIKQEDVLGQLQELLSAKPNSQEDSSY